MNILENTIKELIKADPKDPEDFALFKRKTAKKYKIPIFTNTELLKAYHKLAELKKVRLDKNLENLLKIRKIRSLSGIVIVSVLTKPYPCPGNCLYCPTQKGLPKSYLEGEPAVMRAILNEFDPYSQVKTRIRALENTGHPTDKVDLRIIGGTWSFYPKKYQTWFIKRCFEACNGKKSKTLEEAKKMNEKAKYRMIGITIETRPDYIDEREIKRLREFGVTRVELGIQSIYDDVLKLNRRGHGVKEIIQATRLLKDAGFKICYQMMPNLPGSDLKRDEKMFKEIFTNPDFQPDLLKIYPCALLKEAPLYRVWKKMNYKPYSEKELTSLIAAIKKGIPYYCRIQRIIRDFPSNKIAEGGAKVSNLRQYLFKSQKEEGWKCRCIRCREVKGNYDPKEKVILFREDYAASGGKEIFLSFENKTREKLFSLLRLRIPSKKIIFPALKQSAIIREIHTYGQLHPLSIDESLISPQHKGFGKKMTEEAERIAKKEFGSKHIAVISGIGAREYFRKLGYSLKEEYMVKKI